MSKLGKAVVEIAKAALLMYLGALAWDRLPRSYHVLIIDKESNTGSTVRYEKGWGRRATVLDEGECGGRHYWVQAKDTKTADAVAAELS